MLSPQLPRLPDRNSLSSQGSKGSTLAVPKKSNLKRVLSEQFSVSSHSDDRDTHSVDSNKFLIKTSTGVGVYHRKLLSRKKCVKEGPNPPRHIRFRPTQVILVENWKEHNKPLRFCCGFRIN